MCSIILQLSFFFFFNDTATTEIYTLSLHDALPISGVLGRDQLQRADFLLNVPARTCGEITEEERAGEWSAKHVDSRVGAPTWTRKVFVCTRIGCRFIGTHETQHLTPASRASSSAG